MPNLAIQPATAPVDAPFPPASAQAMLNFVAAYLSISGLENLEGFVKSASSPAAEDQNRAWLRLDPSSGRPLGIYVFNGEWTAVPLVVQSGEETPTAPKKGELFFDVNGGLQVYDGSQWTSNLVPTGTTAKRPESPSIHSLYYDIAKPKPPDTINEPDEVFIELVVAVELIDSPVYKAPVIPKPPRI